MRKESYNSEPTEAALRDMQRDGTPLTTLAKKYVFPRTCLRLMIKNPGRRATCGPSPVLSYKE
jgi:hypothetical protein